MARNNAVKVLDFCIHSVPEGLVVSTIGRISGSLSGTGAEEVICEVVVLMSLVASIRRGLTTCH